MNRWMKFLHRDSRMQEDVHDDLLTKLKSLVGIYDIGTIKVPGLKKINLAIERGEFVVIMGRSGSGKSALMNTLRCLDRPALGHYYPNSIDTVNMRPDQFSDIRNRKIGLVLQSFGLIPGTSILKNMELPVAYARVSKAKRAVGIRLLLERIGLGARKKHMPNELSDGQRQRVAIARTLANELPLIPADKPTGNLDTVSSAEVMELFTKPHQEGATVMLVTHEKNIAASTRHVIRFSDGQIQGDRLNVARVASGSGKGGEQDAD